MKISDYIIDSLVNEGVTHVFEVCGGALSHLLDSMYDRTDIKTVSMHHEMAAAIAAEGYGRISGKIGVAMATSGPGATNLITGIGSCFFDSVPSLFLTGQVNTYEYKFDRPVRQVGFQETDIVSIVKPIVKDAVLVSDATDIKYLTEKMLFIAKNGRPGPTLIDLPMNIQREEVDVKHLKSYVSDNKKDNIDEDVKKAVKSIQSSSRPVVLVGGGVRISDATSELLELINKIGIPVVSSLMGLDAFPHDNHSFMGMIGTYGNRYANLTIANADLVIALGTRFDTRQTGTRPETFARSAKIIHVDLDKNELNNKINVDLPINSDIKEFLVKINSKLDKYNAKPFKNWKNRIKIFKEKYPSFKTPKNDHIAPNYFMHKLSEFLPEDTIICVDVGQNQIWAAQSLELKEHQRFLTEGGMASIGSALPLAIGASFADPNKNIVVITGDGGFQLNIQELQTVFHHQIPIKIILLNNYGYGMIRQFQEQYFNCRFQSTGADYSCPNFQDVVSAYKISTMKISTNIEIDNSLEKLFANSYPMFLEVDINPKFKATPKLSVNKPVEDQEPLLPIEEHKSNMLIDVIDRK
ncbi:thiamine pyrophosphate-binding protein [uncultured Methanobacterium sp.]|uniref:thiamine pyrophosphate-binding protein n=1 Tax=uncultured Methanobacterium sp. TaxID=176306 RepID=UPI002AA7D361|nr:thiamine pyrophosphate-binding protein [uncultured Methanobacterium sp.]